MVGEFLDVRIFIPQISQSIFIRGMNEVQHGVKLECPSLSYPRDYGPWGMYLWLLFRLSSSIQSYSLPVNVHFYFLFKRASNCSH